MCSGPCYVVILEGKNVVSRFRKVMGYYDPTKAEDLTLRKVYGKGCPNNAVHGSDSKSSARREITFFLGINNRTI
jgi:nucleoside-diphosphate kinase